MTEAVKELLKLLKNEILPNTFPDLQIRLTQAIQNVEKEVEASRCQCEVYEVCSVCNPEKHAEMVAKSLRLTLTD